MLIDLNPIGLYDKIFIFNCIKGILTAGNRKTGNKGREEDDMQQKSPAIIKPGKLQLHGMRLKLRPSGTFNALRCYRQVE